MWDTQQHSVSGAINAPESRPGAPHPGLDGQLVAGDDAFDADHGGTAHVAVMSEFTIPELLTEGEVAALTKVPQRTVRQWRTEGTGPTFIKLGKHVRYHPVDVAAYIDQLRGAA